MKRLLAITVLALLASLFGIETLAQEPDDLPEGFERTEGGGLILRMAPEDVPPIARFKGYFLQETLAQEDLQASLAALIQPEPYVFARPMGGPDFATAFPLGNRVGAWTASGVTGNARVWKVIEDLRELGNAAAEVVNREVEATLPLYRQLYEQDFDHGVESVRNAPPPGGNSGYGHGMQVSGNDDGTPTLAGAQCKLLALMGCVAALDLEECRSAVQAVVGEALAQHKEARSFFETDGSRHVRSFAITCMDQASLYNRQLLTAAMLACEPDTAKRAELVERLEIQSGDSRYGGKGTMPVPYCENVSDEEFRSVVEAVFPDLAKQ